MSAPVTSAPELLDRLERVEAELAKHGGFDEHCRAISEAKAELARRAPELAMSETRLRRAIIRARTCAGLVSDNYMLAELDAIDAALTAALSPSEGVGQDGCVRTQDGDNLSIEDMWQRHLDRDDRNSPEEYPDMALIAFEEFRDAIMSFLPANPVPGEE